MSTTAGYFDETLLVSRVVRAQVMGADARLKADSQAWFATLKAVKENNRWQFGELSRSDKDITVQAIYAHLCADNAAPYTSDAYCTQTCGQPSTNAKTFTLNTPIYDCFSLYNSVGRTNEINMDELWATSRIAVDKNLLQLASQNLISAVIEPNLGVSTYFGKGVQNGHEMQFNSAYFTASLVPELMQIAVRNKFNDFYLLDSGLLYNAIQAAKFNAGNANGAGDALAFGTLKYYADLYNIDLVNTPDRVMYMIEPNAIGFLNRANNANITKAAPVQVAADEWRWSEESVLMPGIVYDVHMTIACDPASDEKITTYKYIMRGGAWVNPTGCDSDNTGILRLACV